MSDYDILLLRVEHQDAEIGRLRAALMQTREICEKHPGWATNAIDEIARAALANQEGK